MANRLPACTNGDLALHLPQRADSLNNNQVQLLCSRLLVTGDKLPGGRRHLLARHLCERLLGAGMRRRADQEKATAFGISDMRTSFQTSQRQLNPAVLRCKAYAACLEECVQVVVLDEPPVAAETWLLGRCLLHCVPQRFEAFPSP